MRIAILEHDPASKSATGVRGRAIYAFLRSLGHDVHFVCPPPGAQQRYRRRRLSLTSRISRRLTGKRTLPHVWEYLADDLEPQLHNIPFDLVIARGQDLAYVLTRPIPCLKILDMANILYLEAYYAWGANTAEVEETYEKEVAVWHAVDYIISPHELLTDYYLEQLDRDGSLSAKTVTIRLGCDVATRSAAYATNPRLVYAGSYYYIQDPCLLAQLTRHSPYPIDCYGPEDPNRNFLPAQLNYKGYASGTAFLANYQFGLITLSRDDLRQNSPSTKFPYYFSHGLPVLFPEWMKEGYQYPDCAIPYSPRTFATTVQTASANDKWLQMNNAAKLLAATLTWDNVLRPLTSLLVQAEGQVHCPQSCVH